MSSPTPPVILLADDEVMLRNFLREVLHREGYIVMTAADGAEAVELSGAHSEPIDLLLTDVEMPQLNGVAAYRQISAARPRIKVLFMSGIAQGCTEVPETLPFLYKPFERNALTKRVKQILTSPPHRTAPSPRIILVVDSNAARQERTKDILTANGYGVLAANSVEDAKAITDSVERIDLIVSGVVFPGYSGVHLAEHVEASARTIDTLLISHFHPDLLDGMTGFSRQPEFLQNPFTPTELLGRVRDLLEAK